MSNTHSKQIQQMQQMQQEQQLNPPINDDNFEYDYDYEYIAQDGVYSDKLILKLEDVDVETQEVKLICYVAYDHNENEYFICGKHLRNGHSEEGDFKFYSKTRKNTTSFLKYLFSSPDGSEEVNHVLYNYKYLEDYECVDYWVLYDQEDSRCELSGYDGARFSRSWLSPLLRTLKYVRY